MGPTNKTSLRETPVELLANASNMALAFVVVLDSFLRVGRTLAPQACAGRELEPSQRDLNGSILGFNYRIKLIKVPLGTQRPLQCKKLSHCLRWRFSQ